MKVVIFSIFLASLTVAISASPAPEAKDEPWDCPKNEKYTKCAIAECFTHCIHLTEYPACPQMAPGCYDPACVCDFGYLRNEDGICIPEWQCPQMHVNSIDD